MLIIVATRPYIVKRKRTSISCDGGESIVRGIDDFPQWAQCIKSGREFGTCHSYVRNNEAVLAPIRDASAIVHVKARPLVRVVMSTKDNVDLVFV